jgi:hypothetical protein
MHRVDRVFEPQSGQTKDYTIGSCCFSAKHAALKEQTGWLGIRKMCQSVARVGLEQSGPHHHLIEN